MTEISPAVAMEEVRMTRHDVGGPRRTRSPHAPSRGLLRRACLLGLAGALFMTACAAPREQVVIRPYRVEVPVVVCPTLRSDVLDDVDVPSPPEPMTYGSVVEWAADLVELIHRVRADRAVVRESLPRKCRGAHD